MRASTFLGTLALSAMLASSAPIGNTNGNPGSIYLCNGPNWTGACTYIDHNLLAGGCTPINSAFAHALSVGGDDGPSCTVYSQAGCGGVSLDVTYPGITDTSDVYGWPGTVASFACKFMFDPPE